MKSSIKHTISGSSNTDFALSELKKQKEKILREMKEHEYRKNREIEQKKEKTFSHLKAGAEKNVREKTPPPVIKKIPRVEQKSFAEVMKEAEMRKRQNHNTGLPNVSKDCEPKINQKPIISEQSNNKRKYNESHNTSILSSSIKKKSSVDNLQNNNETLRKKQKLNDRENNVDNSKLKPINSSKKLMPPISINSLANNRNSQILRQPDTSRRVNDNFKSQSNMSKMDSSNSKIRNSNIPPLKSNKDMKSNNSNLTNPSSRSATCGIIAQSKFRNVGNLSSKSGILAQSGVRSTTESGDFKIKKSVDPSQNVNNTTSKTYGVPNESKIRKPLPNQVPLNNAKVSYQAKNKNTNTPNPPATQKKSIANQNYSRNNRESDYSNQFKKSEVPRGICAQNGNFANKFASNYPQARGIAAQNGNFANKYGSNYSQARGIAAQNGSRGILAQSNNGRPPANDNLSGSEEEYDSDLDGFIDDTEDCIDDDIRKEIYKSLNHDPTKYHKVSKYDDCRNMESNVAEIWKEELHSSRVGRMEDNEELKEEERRLNRKGKHL